MVIAASQKRSTWSGCHFRGKINMHTDLKKCTGYVIIGRYLCGVAFRIFRHKIEMPS